MHRSPGFQFAVIALAALLLSHGPAQAQTTAPNRTGFSFGVNFANQGGDMEQAGQLLAEQLAFEFGGSWSSTKSGLTGYQVGAHYAVQTSPTFGIQIEGLYVRRGSSLKFTGEGVPGAMDSVSLTTEFQLNYIEVPLLARFSPSPAARVRAVFLAGPVIGFKATTNMKMSTMGQSQTEDISTGYKTTTFGLLGGIGLSALVGKTTYLTIQGRFYQGLSNVVDDPVMEVTSSDFAVVGGIEFLRK